MFERLRRSLHIHVLYEMNEVNFKDVGWAEIWLKTVDMFKCCVEKHSHHRNQSQKLLVQYKRKSGDKLEKKSMEKTGLCRRLFMKIFFYG